MKNTRHEKKTKENSVVEFGEKKKDKYNCDVAKYGSGVNELQSGFEKSKANIDCERNTEEERRE
jgi:hypothetical protein